MSSTSLKSFINRFGQDWSITFLICSITWLLISPLGSIPDEPSHVYYSASVVRGEIGLDKNIGFVELPNEIANASSKSCTAFDAKITAACQKPIIGDPGSSAVELGTTGYPIFYYLIVGLPTLLDFNELIWYVMRLISVLVSFALIYSTLKLVKLNSFEIGVLQVAFVPMISYLAASINPNGLEIVAALCLSVLLSKLPLVLDKNSDGRYLIQFGILLFILSNVRPYSWLLALAIIVTFFIRDQLFWRRYLIIRAGALSSLFIGTIGLGISYSFWIRHNLMAKVESQSNVRKTLSEVLQSTWPGFDDYLLASPGIFGWLDHRIPGLLPSIWVGVIIFLTFRSIVLLGMSEKLGIILLFIGAVVIAPVAIYWLLFVDGVGYQPRYALALVCSIPIISSFGKEKVAKNITTSEISFYTTLSTVLIISSWLVSFYRYSHGLPFDIFNSGLDSYSFWLPNVFFPLIVFLVTAYLVIQVRMARHSNRKT